MKNKATTYLLIAAVAVIWGTIVYKIVASLSANDDDATFIPATAPAKKAYDDYSAKDDTGKLALNYRDPFGLEPVKDTTAKAIKANTPRSTPMIKSNVPAINWDGIRYSGFMRNPESKKLVSIVSIQGRSAMLQEGETQDNLKLIKNLKDSIKVNYKGSTRYIRLNNN